MPSLASSASRTSAPQRGSTSSLGEGAVWEFIIISPLIFLRGNTRRAWQQRARTGVRNSLAIVGLRDGKCQGEAKEISPAKSLYRFPFASLFLFPKKHKTNTPSGCETPSRTQVSHARLCYDR